MEEEISVCDTDTNAGQMEKVVDISPVQFDTLVDNPYTLVNWLRTLWKNVSHGKGNIQHTLLNQLNKRDCRGYTLLHHASEKKKILSIRILINYGADVNLCIGRVPSYTVLHTCSAFPPEGALDSQVHLQCIKTLMNKEPKLINSTDSTGRTPLIVAILNSQNLNIVQHLLCHSDIDIQDSKGMSALHHATIQEREEVVKILLSKHPNTDHEDSYGKNALYYAENSLSGSKIVHMLKEYISTKAFEELMMEETKKEKPKKKSKKKGKPSTSTCHSSNENAGLMARENISPEMLSNMQKDFEGQMETLVSQKIEKLQHSLEELMAKKDAAHEMQMTELLTEISSSVMKGLPLKVQNIVDKNSKQIVETNLVESAEVQLQSKYTSIIKKEPINKILKEEFASTILPSFNSTCRVMFSQMQQTFQRGLHFKYSVDNRKNAEKRRK